MFISGFVVNFVNPGSGDIGNSSDTSIPKNTYYITNTKADVNVEVSVDTVECVTVEFRNINNVVLTGFDECGFDETLVVWNYDGYSEVGIARIKAGENFEFTAVPRNNTYHIDSVEGTDYNPSNGKYSYRSIFVFV